MEDSSQRTANFDQLLERAAYTYEVVGDSNAMMSKTPGLGQAYLATYADKSGAWLDGGKNYTLHVPAQPPAKNFWSATVYDSGLIDNKQGRGDRGSRDAIKVNADGSVDLFFRPQGTEVGRGQLGADDPLAPVASLLPLLRTARGVLQQKLEAAGHRAEQVGYTLEREAAG